MNIVVVVNQKGGVGKTTTAVNLAYAIAMQGCRVATVDFDPQGHLTASLGCAGRNEHGIGDLIVSGADVGQYCLETEAGLRLLPAGRALKQIGTGRQNLISVNDFAVRLRNLFEDQEFVFVDCPPATGIIMDYALAVADRVLVPVAADYLALRGLSDLVVTLREYAARRSDPIPQVIVVTRFHHRRRLCHEVLAKLLEHFPGKVLATRIRETAALAESPGFGKTVFEYRRQDKGARDYLALADDFIHARYM